MTWIVGGPGFTVPFIAGDICVTFEYAGGHKERYDCLRKIYPIGLNVLAGFAGSVDFGLRLLELAAIEVGPNYLDLPACAVDWFPEFASRHFSSAPDEEQAGTCEILMVGIHPTLQQDMIPTPRTDAVRFMSPDFKPVMTTSSVGVLGIGSGEDLDELRTAALDTVRSNGFSRTDSFGVVGGPINSAGDLLIQVRGGLPGPAAKMAWNLRRAIAEYGKPGVSDWFVYGTVSLDGPPIIEMPIYALQTRAGAQTRQEPPPIVAGTAAFQQFRQDNNLASAVAVG